MPVPNFYDDSVHVLHTVPLFSPLCTRLALEHLLMDGRRRKEGWLMLCKIASFGEALECGVVSSSRFVRKPIRSHESRIWSCFLFPLIIRSCVL